MLEIWGLMRRKSWGRPGGIIWCEWDVGCERGVKHWITWTAEMMRSREKSREKKKRGPEPGRIYSIY